MSVTRSISSIVVAPRRTLMTPSSPMVSIPPARMCAKSSLVGAPERMRSFNSSEFSNISAIATRPR